MEEAKKTPIHEDPSDTSDKVVMEVAITIATLKYLSVHKVNLITLVDMTLADMTKTPREFLTYEECMSALQQIPVTNGAATTLYAYLMRGINQHSANSQQDAVKRLAVMMTARDIYRQFDDHRHGKCKVAIGELVQTMEQRLNTRVPTPAPTPEMVEAAESKEASPQKPKTGTPPRKSFGGFVGAIFGGIGKRKPATAPVVSINTQAAEPVKSSANGNVQEADWAGGGTPEKTNEQQQTSNEAILSAHTAASTPP